ncbi:amidase [Bacillus altitudinis]|uniref:amidase n=1 Tax=Bacillus altitudinis TaxID=293387 RepID=UPI00203AC03B|nr:amidase [Bacillus altitudinis]MCM3064147.1 amidase [Bacillus altitudinis]MCM3076553.1 amidase [Bacillus altitudinis]
MNVKEYMTYDATGLASLVQKKQVTPEELVQAAFARLEEVNPVLNAVIQTRRDQVFKDMKSLDADQPFAGVPFVLKNISQGLEHEPLTAGALLLKDVKAQTDSHFVRRLKQAGLLMIGHTNTPEFGLRNVTEPSLYGPTRNPWNADYSPGGSSGGTAAAVASGIVPAGGASDGGGSIRIPASFTGLFGLKPTRGRTPVGPGAGRQWQGASIDFTLTKTVRDSAALLDLLQVIQPEAAFQTPLYDGSYQEDLVKRTSSMRIAYSVDSPVGTKVSEEAKQAVLNTVKWLSEQGHQIEEVKPDIDGVHLMQQYYVMNSGEMSALFTSLARSFGRPVKPEETDIVAWVLAEAGKNVTAAAYTESLDAWDMAAAKMAAFHQTYDLYVTPATAYSAPKVGELMHNDQEMSALLRVSSLSMQAQQDLIYEMFLKSLTYTPFTQLANLTGQPSMSVPVHLTEAGMPLGVQVTAPKGKEDWLLRLASEIESSSLWKGTHPLLNQ